VGAAVLLSAGLAVLGLVLGIFLAYESYFWPPVQHGWPVSFFIAALVLLEYLLARLWPQRAARRREEGAAA